MMRTSDDPQHRANADLICLDYVVPPLKPVSRGIDKRKQSPCFLHVISAGEAEENEAGYRPSQPRSEATEVQVFGDQDSIQGFCEG
jgi:hypothetical protein